MRDVVKPYDKPIKRLTSEQARLLKNARCFNLVELFNEEITICMQPAIHTVKPMLLENEAWKQRARLKQYK